MGRWFRTTYQQGSDVIMSADERHSDESWVRKDPLLHNIKDKYKVL
jgi:hypothetical protein